MTRTIQRSAPFSSGIVTLAAMADKGLAHWHLRILVDAMPSGWIARVPKQSQMQLAPKENLAYEAACFERASASRHTPHLLFSLPPNETLPWGALIVQEIVGRPARLPHDLAAIADTLASLHALPMGEDLAPIQHANDPLAELLREIEQQALALPSAELTPACATLVTAELQRLKLLCAKAARPPRCLISFDTHPGNFLLDAQGTAVLVDLEKCRYSYPGLDLAHATLYTSTTWDVESSAQLSENEVLDFYRQWQKRLPPKAAFLSEHGVLWHVPLRRAMWLWSVTWCARWRSDYRDRNLSQAREASSSELIAHVQERVDHYLHEQTIARLCLEFDSLERRLAAD